MAKILFILILVLPSLVYAGQGMGPGPGIGSFSISFAKVLASPDGKAIIGWSVPTGEVFMITPGTESWNKILGTPQAAPLVIPDNTPLKTP